MAIIKDAYRAGEYQRLSKTEIRKQGTALYNDFLGPRTSREAFFMKSEPEELAYRLVSLATTDEHQRGIAAAISVAAEALNGVNRLDGLPHLRHALRVGLRTMYRLRTEHGTLSDADIEKVKLMINHDTLEDGRTGRKQGNFTKQEVHDIFLNHFGRENVDTDDVRHTKNTELFRLIEVFDKHREHIVNEELTLLEDPDYLQRLKDAGLGPEKMDDTVDSMTGDMAKASSVIRQANRGKKDPAEIQTSIESALKQLKKSSTKTLSRKNFFQEQLSDYQQDQLDISLHAAELFINALEEKQKEFKWKIRRRKLSQATKDFFSWPPRRRRTAILDTQEPAALAS